MRVAKNKSSFFKGLDYYPFGAEKPGRTFNSGEYKYGYNGKEMDNEVSGEGNSYDYGFRIYNPRLGKFLSVDPLFQSYPWYTPYQFAGNDPIRNIDIDGLEGGSAIEYAFTDLANSLEYKWNETKSWWNSWSLLPSTAPNKTADPIKTDLAKAEIKKVDDKKVIQKVTASNNTASAKWMEIAKKEIGQKEISGKENNPKIIEYHSTTGGFKDDETPWCSSFCNWVMKASGNKGTGSAKALSWKSWGKSTEGKPVYGAIAIIDYGGGKGHVGFVTGVDGDNITILLGGNQSDQVKESKFKKSAIVDYRVPSDYVIPESDKKPDEKKIDGKTEDLNSTR